MLGVDQKVMVATLLAITGCGGSSAKPDPVGELAVFADRVEQAFVPRNKAVLGMQCRWQNNGWGTGARIRVPSADGNMAANLFDDAAQGATATGRQLVRISPPTAIAADDQALAAQYLKAAAERMDLDAKSSRLFAASYRGTGTVAQRDRGWKDATAIGKRLTTLGQAWRRRMRAMYDRNGAPQPSVFTERPVNDSCAEYERRYGDTSAG